MRGKGIITVKKTDSCKSAVFMKTRSREEIIRNLKDAGCDAETIENYMKCCDCGEVQKKEKLLEKHRKSLLEDLHQCQKEIDCLDYLIYREKKEE